MDVLVENAKREDGWQSFMLEEPHFVSYGIWHVVLHGMLAPRSKVGDGTLFPGFFLLV
jgi:hypothetical protein